MNYTIYNGELCHYGVKGMKWGHRKAKDSVDKRTKYKTDALDEQLSAGTKTERQYKKLLKNYTQAADKDLKKAYKNNDSKQYNKILAGRTLAKFMLDNNYANRAITDAAVSAKAEVGKDFTYNMKRNDKAGTVDIKINGKTSSYSHLTKSDIKRMNR